METFIRPDRSLWEELCSRPSSPRPEIEAKVREIIARVRRDGDRALAELSMELEGRSAAGAGGNGGTEGTVKSCACGTATAGLYPKLVVRGEDFTRAEQEVSPAVKEAIAVAAANIRAFHQAQMPAAVEVETSPGVRCIQKPVAIERVGLYIPGGTAPLFSTVLMLAIPASLAGCREVVLCTPARRDGNIAPEVLYAARYCGISRVFAVGGAQAVAAMAYGTESVPRVDKIFGPGNQWVTCAKQLVSKDAVAIDMPAGPSEVMVIADEHAEPGFVAADLLSQAEHGSDSQVMLVCRSDSFAQRVKDEIRRQLRGSLREDFASKALEKSRCIVLDSSRQMQEFAECYAPEHLIINTSDPWSICSGITRAGSVFIGSYTPESAGDYASGTNHTLPTCGWARSFSGVNMDSFMRKMTIQEISRRGLLSLAPTIVSMARAEGLEAHANAVRVRIEKP